MSPFFSLLIYIHVFSPHFCFHFRSYCHFNFPSFSSHSCHFYSRSRPRSDCECHSDFSSLSRLILVLLLISTEFFSFLFPQLCCFLTFILLLVLVSRINSSCYIFLFLLQFFLSSPLASQISFSFSSLILFLF